MRFTPLPLAGAFVVDVDYIADVRGGFARTYCVEEFAAAGITAPIAQCATSFNARAGTLRGLHFQVGRHAQAKLVRATSGAIFDVIVDIRSGSPTYGQHVTAELDADSRRMLYIPADFAHCFLTLGDDTEVFYQFDRPWAPGAEGGINYADESLAIAWPREITVINDRDRNLPRL